MEPNQWLPSHTYGGQQVIVSAVYVLCRKWVKTIRQNTGVIILVIKIPLQTNTTHRAVQLATEICFLKIWKASDLAWNVIWPIYLQRRLFSLKPSNFPSNNSLPALWKTLYHHQHLHQHNQIPLHYLILTEISLLHKLHNLYRSLHQPTNEHSSSKSQKQYLW